MKHMDLRTLLFLALACDIGLFAKRIIAPFANILTDAMHIPGGIGTSFSLMFLVVAAMLVKKTGCAVLMGAMQSVIALSFGMVGSMGLLAPVGYIVPGIVIDVIVSAGEKLDWDDTFTAVIANMLAAAAAGLTANVIVFNLRGIPLMLYVAVALTSGALCGLLGTILIRRLRPAVLFHLVQKEEGKDE